MDKVNLTVTAHSGEEAQNEEALFIIDTQTDSAFQNMLIAGEIEDVSHSVNNASKQFISWRISGEKMINETPLDATVETLCEVYFG